MITAYTEHVHLHEYTAEATVQMGDLLSMLLFGVSRIQ